MTIAALYLIIGYLAVLYIGITIGGIMTSKRNEKTSKEVARKASNLMRQISVMQDQLLSMHDTITKAVKLFDEAKSAAASALTQREKK